MSLNQTSHLLNNKSAFQIHKNLLDRPLRVVTYTDAAGIGGAEISLSHLIATVSDNIDVTVLGTSQHVVNAIAALRPQASRLVLPATGLGSASTHFTARGGCVPMWYTSTSAHLGYVQQFCLRR